MFFSFFFNLLLSLSLFSFASFSSLLFLFPSPPLSLHLYRCACFFFFSFFACLHCLFAAVASLNTAQHPAYNVVVFVSYHFLLLFLLDCFSLRVELSKQQCVLFFLFLIYFSSTVGSTPSACSCTCFTPIHTKHEANTSFLIKYSHKASLGIETTPQCYLLFCSFSPFFLSIR